VLALDQIMGINTAIVMAILIITATVMGMVMIQTARAV